MTEGKKLDPRVSEFETEEQAESYDRWFRKKVQESLDDGRPTIPHEEAMAQVKQVIKDAAARSKRPVMTEDKKLDPRVSEFETQEQADSYDRWFRKTVQESLDDGEPTIPHDEVMAGIDAIIERAESKLRRKKA
jgi:hypothetical protein